MRDFLKDQEGQAVVEYLLVAASILTMVSIMAIGFRRSIAGLWETFSKEITAGCPGCPADQEIRIR